MKGTRNIPIILFAFLYFVKPSSANELCNANLGEWLKCNNPVVIKYLDNLTKNDIGRIINGVKLSDGVNKLSGYKYLGKNRNTPHGVNLHMFQSKSGKVAYLWVENKAKEFPLPQCGNGELPLSPYALSGDMYTWKSAQPGHGVIVVHCPPAEWEVKPNKAFNPDANKDSRPLT